MNLHVLEIPDSQEQLAGWIESNVMFESFGEFIGQLQIIRESGPKDVSLNLTQILGNDAEAMVEFGLDACSQKQLRQLLAHPTALIELQEVVFENRYSYWFNEYSYNSAKNFDAHSDLQKIRNSIQQLQSIKSTAGRRKFGWLVATAIIAASLFLVIFLAKPDESRSSVKWGWLADDVYQEYETPSDCFANLAERGNEWFDATPSDDEQFSVRLTQLRAGCDRLIATKQAVLSEEDQTWLVERCKKWAGVFAMQQNEIKTNPENFPEILQQTNETVRKLVAALHEKSKSS